MLLALRLTPVLARPLREQGVAAVAVSPGHVRGESMLSPKALRAEYGAPPGTPPVVDTSAWGPEDAPRHNGLSGYLWRTESAQYTGRAVALLASDPRVMERTGRVHLVGDLAREYGFADIDGRQPHYQEETPRWRR